MSHSFRQAWRTIRSQVVRSPGESPVATIILCALLCLNGIWWGQNELWNADPVAFKDHFREGALPFSPESFDKPPLLSYISFFTAIVPGELVARSASIALGADGIGALEYTSTWLLKVWHLVYACLAVYLLWRIVALAAGPRAAGISSILLATSAGFIVQAHLITTDLPLVLIMLLAFFTSQRLWNHHQLRDYVIAGICIGLTGALKYNGLVVGLALPVFHLMRDFDTGFFRKLFDRRLILGVACVPLGFLLGNPFAAIEFKRFAGDVMYQLVAAPDYVGANNLLDEQQNIMVTLATDLIGWPLFLVLCIGLPLAVVLSFKDRSSLRWATMSAATAIGVVYGLYFHLQSNVQVRWLLPLVPLLLIAAAPAWEALSNTRKNLSYGVVAVVVLYGTACAILAGLRFVSDPRFDAVRWVAGNVSKGATIESSSYVPRWNYHGGIDIRYVRMPSVSGRRRIYEDLFSGNPAMLEEMRSRERDNTSWYATTALNSRAPDYIAVSSLYFDRFYEQPVASYYPELARFFTELLNGGAGYTIVFDEACCTVPGFLYPQQILFVDNRIVILRRDDAGTGPKDVE